VGRIDGHFAHAYADVDYGLRATAAAVTVVLASDAVGHCEANPAGDLSIIYDARVPVRVRWRAAMNRRGIPWRSQARLFRRHGGRLWPVLYVMSYVRVLRPPRRPDRAGLTSQGRRAG
jgi:GT2 family glycosyltransferase